MVLMQDLPTLGPQSTREADDWIGQTESHRRKEFRRGNKGVVVVVVGGNLPILCVTHSPSHFSTLLLFMRQGCSLQIAHPEISYVPIKREGRRRETSNVPLQ